jgi:hypothetical protein
MHDHSIVPSFFGFSESTLGVFLRCCHSANGYIFALLLGSGRINIIRIEGGM